jgi:uncharacterized protein (TIGR02569 family)
VAQHDPPPSVLAAFGASGDPVPLEGGQGSSWLAGEVVLKRLDMTERELTWLAELHRSIRCDGFRVSLPVRARNDELVVDGWCGWERVSGHHEDGRWPDIIAVGERFHAAIAGIPRPEFIAARSHQWAIADRVAWGELPADRFERVRHLPRLLAALRPVDAPSQLVHSDLTGNVLFAEGLPPAIIDLSLFWRPPAYASAIVVADALVWEGAGEDLLESVTHDDDWEQFLLRALIFRAVTGWLLDEQRRTGQDDDDPYLPVVDVACRRASSTSP